MMTSRFGLMCFATGAITLALGACQKSENPAPAKTSINDDALKSAPWNDVVADAKGKEVRWFFWSGNPSINRYIDDDVIPQMKRLYDIRVKRVPVKDPALAINRLLAEKKVGKKSDGKVDMVWVNGENFRTGHSEKLFFGPFAKRLPEHKNVNAQDPSIKFDFGVPHDDYESPWSRAQFVMIYDSEKVPKPPRTLAELDDFVAKNPGRFTYAAPPDFTGSVFLRHLLYQSAGGHQRLKGKFDQNIWNDVAPPLFARLKKWKPNLWRKGETYPESTSRLHQLFGQGEVYMSMSYGPESAQNKVRDGQFKKSTRTYLFKQGTIANTSFVAIPFNSPNKSAAMVLANHLLSAKAQARKQDPSVWGAMSVLDFSRLSDDERQLFAKSKDPNSITLSASELNQNALPEIHPTWAERLEKDWEQEVARAP